MKTTFLSLFAVIATASFLQASNAQPLPDFNVSAERFAFIDERLEAVVDEQVAKAKEEPIPAKVLAAAMTRPHARLAMIKDLQGLQFLVSNHS